MPGARASSGSRPIITPFLVVFRGFLSFFSCLGRRVSGIIRLLDLMKVLGGRKVAMKRFYYQTWLPFIATKKHILILTVATYAALC